MSWILGISGNYLAHELSFALVDDSGTLQFVAEEERYTRIRHQIGALPSVHGLTDALQQCGISVSDIGEIAVGYAPALFARRSSEYERTFLQLGFQTAEDYLLQSLRLDNVLVSHFPHHLAHASSSFFTSGFARSAVLTIDGIGEVQTCGIYIGEANGLVRVWEKSHESIGRLYTRVTQWLGLGALGDEGKTMGLASYGQPRFLETFRKIVNWDEETGDFFVDSEMNTMGFSIFALEKLLGPRRSPKEPITAFHKDVAATIQVITEAVVLGLARKAHQMTGEDRLCIAGGVGQNSVTNGILAKEGPFLAYHIPPWVGDCGLSIGAALLAFHKSRRDRQAAPPTRVSPYLGRVWSEEEVEHAVKVSNIPYQVVNDPIHVAADALSQGRIVGWFQGRAEIGARALGNRSILANPTIPSTKDIVNRRVKFREDWRPFAPSVAMEDVDRYFETHGSALFMTTVFRFRAEVQHQFPSVTHIDGTGRVQEVTEDINPMYYRLLQAVKERTGHALVLNTSLNIKGEPIAYSPSDAIRTFLSSGLDVLVIGNILLDKNIYEYPRWHPFRLQQEDLRRLGTEAMNVGVLMTEAFVMANRARTGPESAARGLRNLRDFSKHLTILTDNPRRIAELLDDDFASFNVESLAKWSSSLDVLFVATESRFLDVAREDISLCKKICESEGIPGYLLVLDITVHPLELLQPFWKLFEVNYFASQKSF